MSQDDTQAHRLTRLRQLLDDGGPERGRIARFAKKHQMDASYISQLLNKHRAFGEKAAAAFEEQLGLPRHWFDTVDLEGVASMSLTASGTLTDGNVLAAAGGRDEVQIPKLAVTASMGQGVGRPEEDVITGMIAVSPSWVNREFPGARRESLRFITGYGDSMSPTFKSGDVLLVDTAVQSVAIDGIYVLSNGPDLYIKRVTRGFDGKFEVSSDNPKVRKTEALNGDHQVQVLGRVLFIWNGSKV